MLPTDEISSLYSHDQANDTTTTLPRDKSFASKTDVNDQGRSASPTPPGSPRSHEGIPVQWASICLRTVGIIFPFGAAVAVFTWLVLSRRLEKYFGYTDRDGSFTIDRQSSTLILLPTLSSIFAILALRPLISLTSYIHAWLLLNNSKLLGNNKPPTPYEFGLLLVHLNGGLGSLWITLLYSHRPRQRTLLMRQLMGGVVLSSLALLLSILVIASSIWVHASTKMVQVQQILPPTEPIRLWGRRLAHDCLLDPSASPDQASVNFRLDGADCRGRSDLLLGSGEAYLTAQNRSSSNRVLILTGTPLALLADAEASFTTPFSASSYAISSSCNSIGKDCQLDPDELTYNCPTPAFSGTLTKDITLHYWNSSTSNSEDADWTVALHLKGVDNTFSTYANTSDVALTGRNSGILTVFRCSSQVHEVSYSYTGGQTVLQESTLVNSTVTNLILSAMFPKTTEGYAGFGNDLLDEGISAVVASAESVDHLGTAFALIFSQTAIASASGIMAPITIEGDLVTKLVTVMPKAAFCLLCFANIALAVWALALGTIATIVSRGRAGVADVQARLSILGLTARAFETPHQARSATSIKQLFHQDEADPEKRIRIVRSDEGGWVWIAA